MTRKLQANNRSTLTGLRLVMAQSHGMRRPVLYVQVSWQQGGRLRNTHYSTQRHGPIGATALALLARAEGTGQPVPPSARSAWMRMRAARPDLFERPVPGPVPSPVAQASKQITGRRL